MGGAGIPSEFEFESPVSTGDVVLPSVPGIPGGGSVISEPSYYENLARSVRVLDEAGDPHLETPSEREARRLAERLPDGYRPTSATELTFDPRIAYELALGVDKAEGVFEKYGLTEAEAEALLSNPAFAATVKKYQEEVLTSGVSFKLKAKIQAEDLLTHSYLIATDPEAPMSVRADLIKWTARVAGLEPKEEKASGTGGGFTLSITFAGDRPVEKQISGEVIDA